MIQNDTRSREEKTDTKDRLTVGLISCDRARLGDWDMVECAIKMGMEQKYKDQHTVNTVQKQKQLRRPNEQNLGERSRWRKCKSEQTETSPNSESVIHAQPAKATCQLLKHRVN